MADKPKQTAQQKAQEALEVANRKVKKLEEKRDKAKADLAAAIESLEAETATRDYVAQHPALKSVEEHQASVTPTAAGQPAGEGTNTLGF